ASDTHRATGDRVTLTVNGKPVSVRITGEVFIPNPVAAMWVSSQTLGGLGVLNAALMATRERVHDLGVFKAVGMTPRQTITMVVCWVIAPAVIAAAIAVPAGLIIQDLLVRQLTSGTALQGTALPGNFVHVLGGTDLL